MPGFREGRLKTAMSGMRLNSSRSYSSPSSPAPRLSRAFKWIACLLFVTILWPESRAFQPNTNYPTFKILMTVPIEKASAISRELTEAISWWEGIHRNIGGRPNWNNIYAPSGDDMVPGNLQFSQIHVSNDTLRLFNVLCDSLERDTPSIILSLIDSKKTDYMRMIAESSDVPLLTLSQDYMKERNIVRPLRQGIHESRSMEMSLDPPVSSLADAAFELLRSQNWFDAILVIDDTTASDLLTYRLTRLCRRSRRYQTNSLHPQQGDPDRPDRYEARRKSWITKKAMDYHTIDSVWGRLKVIRISKNLLQKEFYLRVSEIQTSHRRVVLVHCDEIVTKKVVDTAKNLNLFEGQKIWILMDGVIGSQITSPALYRNLDLPDGMLALHQRAPQLTNTTTLFDIIKLFGEVAETTFINTRAWLGEADFRNGSIPRVSCYQNASSARIKYSEVVYRELKKLLQPMQTTIRYDHHKCKSGAPQTQPAHVLNLIHKNYVWPFPVFDILNLVSSSTIFNGKEWKVVGNVTRHNATLDAIRFISRPSSDRSVATAKHHFRVVTAMAPPFVQQSSTFEKESCLVGVPCLKVRSNIPEELVVIFTDFNSRRRDLEGKSYIVLCCAGIAIDLLTAAARDLDFGFDLYLAADGNFGASRNGIWDGITGDLVSGAAHVTFAAFSVTSERAEVIDYSVPFFYSGISCLSFSRKFDEFSFSGFLKPFSAGLWSAIATLLVVISVVAAIYEWISPVGLNPWGSHKGRTFSATSSLWLFTCLLFRHFAAFKTPKASTNKLLIHTWGAFCTIFWCTYVAKIAVHFTSYLPTYEINDFNDGILMPMRTGVIRSSSAEGYLKTENAMLWHHIQNHRVHNVEEGIEKLRKGALDILIGDTAIFEYYRATERGCPFRLLGQPIFDDTYGVGMQRDFPLKDALSDLILSYIEYGFMDQLQAKWWGRAPCLSDIRSPTPLSIFSLAGVFLLLVVGLLVGLLILTCEYLVFKYSLPKLRKKSKSSFWKNRKLMFFSQKLYRFVNTVEGVSSYYSIKDGDSIDSEGKTSRKSLKTDVKQLDRRSSF